METKIITPILAALIGLLTACNGRGSDVLGTGNFEATEVLVGSEVSGLLQEWRVEEGMTIEANTMVGLVDTTQLYLQKESLRRSGRSVTAARPDVSAQTSAIEAQLSNLRVERDRVQRLLSADVATRKELDEIETAIRVAEGQLDATRSSLNSSNAQITAQSSAVDIQVAQVEDMIARSIIKSPISGTVTANYVQQGELTGAGRPLFRVADLSEMTLRAYVSAEHLAALKLGDTVTVRVDGDGTKAEYQGTLGWISSKSEFTPKTVQTEDERSNLVYAVKVRVPNDGHLRIGMYGEIVRTAAQQTTVVP